METNGNIMETNGNIMETNGNIGDKGDKALVPNLSSLPMGKKDIEEIVKAMAPDGKDYVSKKDFLLLKETFNKVLGFMVQDNNLKPLRSK